MTADDISVDQVSLLLDLAHHLIDFFKSRLRRNQQGDHQTYRLGSAGRQIIAGDMDREGPDITFGSGYRIGGHNAQIAAKV